MCVDGQDNDGDGDHLRPLLAAATLRHGHRWRQSIHLELWTHPAGLVRVSLVVSQQLLLEPNCLLLDEWHTPCRLHIHSGDVVYNLGTWCSCVTYTLGTWFPCVSRPTAPPTACPRQVVYRSTLHVRGSDFQACDGEVRRAATWAREHSPRTHYYARGTNSDRANNVELRQMRTPTSQQYSSSSSPAVRACVTRSC